MKKFHGSRVGAKAKRVWVCENCGGWHHNKPALGCEHVPCDCSTFIHFPSRAEAKRYANLRLQESQGMIHDLALQPRFPLYVTTPSGDMDKIGEYRADFAYFNKRGQRIIEDVKGNADTHMSAWKRKHCQAQYGLIIHVVQG